MHKLTIATYSLINPHLHRTKYLYELEIAKNRNVKLEKFFLPITYFVSFITLGTAVKHGHVFDT